MNVLVTGISGHVGGAVARHLVLAGHRVFGLSRTAPAQETSVAGYVCIDLANDGLVEHVAATLPRCEAIVHAGASLSKDPFDAVAMAVNTSGTQRVLRLARAWGSGAFVYISGVSVIGSPGGRPLDEARPPRPATPYTAAKLLGEHLTFMLAPPSRAVVLRLSSPVGPGLRAATIFSTFVKNAVTGAPLMYNGDGSRRQNYVDVRDVARAVEAALAGAAAGVFNIGGAESVSNRELAERCVATLGSDSPILASGAPDPDDGVTWDVPLDAARRALGYAPQYTLEDAIRALAEEYGSDAIR